MNQEDGETYTMKSITVCNFVKYYLCDETKEDEMHTLLLSEKLKVVYHLGDLDIGDNVIL